MKYTYKIYRCEHYAYVYIPIDDRYIYGKTVEELKEAIKAYHPGITKIEVSDED